MSYCVYNKKLDQFLYLFYSYDEHGGPICEASWGDEFSYALADYTDNVPIETVWPNDTEHGSYFLFVCRRIDQMDSSETGMKHIQFVPVTDEIPNFEEDSLFLGK